MVYTYIHTYIYIYTQIHIYVDSMIDIGFLGLGCRANPDALRSATPGTPSSMSPL